MQLCDLNCLTHVLSLKITIKNTCLTKFNSWDKQNNFLFPTAGSSAASRHSPWQLHHFLAWLPARAPHRNTGWHQAGIKRKWTFLFLGKFAKTRMEIVIVRRWWLCLHRTILDSQGLGEIISWGLKETCHKMHLKSHSNISTIDSKDPWIWMFLCDL